uniref:Uncharacterized protein n=1 Tax=Syphacia muris TaxID=451379 RepID=A0A0N5AGW3_9BILA
MKLRWVEETSREYINANYGQSATYSSIDTFRMCTYVSSKKMNAMKLLEDEIEEALTNIQNNAKNIAIEEEEEEEELEEEWVEDQN